MTSSAEPPVNPPSYQLKYVSDDLTYPQLNFSVYIEGPPEDQVGFPSWLGRAGCSRVLDPNVADLVIFSGGSDVYPLLYGEAPMEGTYYDKTRDDACVELFQKCAKDGIPMLGICRGAQFLWVMKGGKLWQDVNNHNAGEHTVTLLETNQQMKASSVHHQACRFGVSGSRLLMSGGGSTVRKSQDAVQTGPLTDIEGYVFEKDCILGFQGHPEYSGYPVYSKICLDLIDKYIMMSTRTRVTGGLFRVVD